MVAFLFVAFFALGEPEAYIYTMPSIERCWELVPLAKEKLPDAHVTCIELKKGPTT